VPIDPLPVLLQRDPDLALRIVQLLMPIRTLAERVEPLPTKRRP